MNPGRFLVAGLAALAWVASAVPPAEAQSLFAGRGLGYVMEPVDGRGRGLGGVGLGLPEPGLSLINPAGVAGLPAAALHVTLQPDQFTSQFNGAEVSATTVRFPLIHAALPFRRWTATIGYSSFLDRNWAVERDTTLIIGGSPVEVRDRFASHGGVARLRLGTAYALNQRLAVGASVDVYSGSVQDTVYRIFQETTLRPTNEPSNLSFRGTGFGAGARWVPSPAFALEASVSGGGTLEVRPALETVPVQQFELPLMAAAGVSGRITPTTLVALSGRWNGWSAVDGALANQGGARDTWSVAGGIEWEAIQVGERVVPVRLGGRHGLLPFRWDDTGDWPTESAGAFGAGLRLAGGAASLDGAVERGRRGDAVGITESFWRMTFSLTVLGR
jgi:hypothetical protein